MDKLQFNKNKTIKLTNVLKYKLIVEDGEINLEAIIEQMQNYIKIKGATQIGPIIQYTKPFLNDAGELDMDIVIMLQCDKYIHNIDGSYSMDSVKRVKNCMYCRYIGPEDKLKFAYDKINLVAFEEDIPLKGDSYTIFVDQQDDDMIADVFMERADDE